jgi:predicted nucleic acid-binding protein
VVLVDTSVWVEVFRKPTRFCLDSVLDLEDVVTCPPVVQEVLQGFRDARSFAVARNAMLAMPMVESPMAIEIFMEAAELYRHARRSGLTIRSGVDCLIAACAIRNGLPVLHRDRDYDALAGISALDAGDIRGR